MAVDIKFDLAGNPESPTIILATRNGNKLGQLDVDEKSIELTDKLNDASEFTFTLNKYVDGKLANLWDKVTNFKLVYCKEWDMWFEITVELDEATETIKTVFCTQLGQAELSQIMLYDVEINTEDDIARDDYKISILYNSRDAEASILDRMLDKAPHYSIAHVDSTIAKIQRSFSFDGTSLYDAFQEVAEEIGCLFVFHSNSDANGNIQRTISVYDLQQNCNRCGCRGEYTNECPKCGSTNITNGYGEDTLIFVTSDELASSGIQFVTNTDSVKNCFKLEAGDDLMTATIRTCNPNGSDYIWYFPDIIKEDMSDELVEKLEEYDALYKQYYSSYTSNVSTSSVNSYNSLVNKYSSYNSDLQRISTPIIGYTELMNAYHKTMDLSVFLKSGLMPSVSMSETNASEQAGLLTSSALSPVAVADVTAVSLSTANSAVLAMAKTIVKPTYKVTINTSEISNSGNSKYWRGNFTVTNYSDENDMAISSTISVSINDDLETFVKQKIDKALNREVIDDLSITELFNKGYSSFKSELQKYGLNSLTSIYNAAQSCIDVLIEQGIGDDVTWAEIEESSGSNLYKNLYTPYYEKLGAVEKEIKLRENEINAVTNGLQANIERCKGQIQKHLDFQNFLGNKLWLEFCAYRREDKYTNENYISDGLSDNQLTERALQFIEVAENELYKSAELQHSISTTLNNLLAIPKFKPLVKSFKVGNWIRVQIDDRVYKLRLLEYVIDYSDFNNIPVEFADIVKVKGGANGTNSIDSTDTIGSIESILEQASSMATSYDSVQRQAEKGDKANGTIDQWIADGLNSALVQISNNNNEEVTLSKGGLLCRSYDDVAEGYSPEQFRLTHNIMCYTTDEWKTVKQAIGKHDYVIYDENNNEFVSKTGYGMTADFVTAAYITGSQIIGGDIYSSNYTIGTDSKGSHIDLNEGDFSFGGEKIVYDADKNVLTLKNVTIEWETTNSPEIEDIDGLSDSITNAEQNAKDYADEQDKSLKEYVDGDFTTTLTKGYQDYANSEVSKLDNAVANYLGLDGSTLIGEDYIISPYIAGGYLNITGKDIDENTGLDTGNGLRVLIDPNNYTGNGFVFQILDTKYDNGDNTTGRVIMAVDGEGSAIFNGTVYATDGEFTGTITSTEGTIAGWTIKDYKMSKGTFRTSDYIGLYSDFLNSGDGYLNSNGNSGNTHAKIGGVLSNNWGIIAGTNFGVTRDGHLAAAAGTIAGWTIKDYKMSKGEFGTSNYIGLFSSFPSDGDEGGSATISGFTSKNWRIIAGTNFGVTREGYLAASNATISGEITATSGSLEDLTIEGRLKFGGNDSYYIDANYNDSSYYLKLPGFQVDEASGINIESSNRGKTQIVNIKNGEISLEQTYNSRIYESLYCAAFTSYANSTNGYKMDVGISNGGMAIGYLSFGDINRITIGSTGGALYGTWTVGGNEIATVSDANKKNSIVGVTEPYDVLFDNLQPVLYKYNDGDSGRVHTGFIAQDVYGAIDAAGLSTNDLAAYVSYQMYNQETESTEDVLTLRYSEFVSLNTWQIQRAKVRISELESKVASLESKIALLTNNA